MLMLMTMLLLLLMMVIMMVINQEQTIHKGQGCQFWEPYHLKTVLRGLSPHAFQH